MKIVCVGNIADGNINIKMITSTCVAEVSEGQEFHCDPPLCYKFSKGVISHPAAGVDRWGGKVHHPTINTLLLLITIVRADYYYSSVSLC